MANTASPTLNRRKSPRHYLDRPMPIEVVYGRHHFAIESGRLSDISRQGIGVHAEHPLRLPAGAPVTVAATMAGETFTVTGRIAYANQGNDVGVEIDDREAQRQLDRIADALTSVVVTPPENGIARIEGKVSMSARHPILWAVHQGATSLDMSRATEIDSAGLGLLALMHERHGLHVEHCPAAVCRLVQLAHVVGICTSRCPRSPRSA